jgi:SAM-dependent methyltransferase
MADQNNIHLVVAWMIEGDEDVWKLSYDSVKDVADAFVIVDGNHYEGERSKYVPEDNKTIVIHSPYPHSDKGADGQQRNKYLDVIKEKFPGSWVLVLDADEFVDEASKIKPFIQELEASRFDSCSPFMRHLVYNLGYEDATLPQHFVPLRLFKVNPNLQYPEVEHNVLTGSERAARGSTFTIWHLGYAREIIRLRKKYFNHSEKSNIHSADFLTWWYHAHLYGEYPVKQVPKHEIPVFLRSYLKVNDDYNYFKNRGSELKHWEDAAHWVDFFKPKTALEVGCGLGHRVRALKRLGVESTGVELSSWAVEHVNSDVGDCVSQGDVLDSKSAKGKYDLVVAYDLLEHVEEKDLDAAIKNIKNWTNQWVLVSIPFAADPATGEPADPNLYNDSTHKTFRSRSWWIAKFAEHRLAVVPTPEHFNYRQQLLVLKKQGV